MSAGRREKMPAGRDDSLALRPVRNMAVTEERLPDGGVLLRYPVTLRPWIAGVLKWTGRGDGEQRTRKLQLDVLGSEVWGMIDGVRSVGRMVDLFAGRHRVAPREAEIAITQFLRDLGRRGIIGLR